jgi:uncharacterized membrane protein YdjX (TVP38/TMEM64 family)
MSRKSYLPLAIFIILVLAILLVGTQVPENTIRRVVASAGPYGIVVLILSFWLTNVVAPLGGTPFLYAGFYLYGQKVVFYAYFASIIASVTNFWIARVWGRSLVEKLAGREGLEKIDHLAKDYGISTLIIFRLFLKEFHDVVSYAFGLTEINFISYFVISVLGMLPATIIWYFVSKTIQTPLIFTIISWLIAYISLTSYILWIELKKRHK